MILRFLFILVFGSACFGQGTLYKGSFTGNGGPGPVAGQTGLTNIQLNGIQSGVVTPGLILSNGPNGNPVLAVSTAGGGGVATYYFSPSGSDAAGVNGLTPSSAFLTLTNAAAKCAPGSVFDGMGQSYSNWNYVLTNPGTYQNFSVTVTNTNVPAVLIVSNSNIRLHNFTLTGTTNFITNTTPGGYNNFIANGIFIGANAGYGPSNVVIDAFKISSFNTGIFANATNYTGIQIDGLVITNGHVFNCGQFGIFENINSETPPVVSQYGSNCLIDNVQVDHIYGLGAASVGPTNSAAGIAVLGWNGGKVNNCSTHDNGQLASLSGGCVGIEFVFCFGVTGTNDESYNNGFTPGANDMYGFDIDSDCTLCSFSYCAAWNNGGPGLSFAGSTGGNISNGYNYCLSWGNAARYVAGVSLGLFPAEGLVGNGFVSTNDYFRSCGLFPCLPGISGLIIATTHGSNLVTNCIISAPLSNNISSLSQTAAGYMYATDGSNVFLGNDWWTAPNGFQSWTVSNGVPYQSLTVWQNGFTNAGTPYPAQEPTAFSVNPINMLTNWPNKAQGQFCLSQISTNFMPWIQPVYGDQVITAINNGGFAGTNNNSFIGQFAGNRIGALSSTTVMGWGAGLNLSNAFGNVLCGAFAAFGATNLYNSTILGFDSFLNAYAGTNIISLGAHSGSSAIGGETNNIYLLAIGMANLCNTFFIGSVTNLYLQSSIGIFANGSQYQPSSTIGLDQNGHIQNWTLGTGLSVTSGGVLSSTGGGTTNLPAGIELTNAVFNGTNTGAAGSVLIVSLITNTPIAMSNQNLTMNFFSDDVLLSAFHLASTNNGVETADLEFDNGTLFLFGTETIGNQGALVLDQLAQPGVLTVGALNVVGATAFTGTNSVALSGANTWVSVSAGSTPTFSPSFTWNGGNGTQLVVGLNLTNVTLNNVTSNAPGTNTGPFFTNYYGAQITNIMYGHTNIYTSGVWTQTNSSSYMTLDCTAFAFTNGANYIQWSGATGTLTIDGVTLNSSGLTGGPNFNYSGSNFYGSNIFASMGFFGTFYTTNVNTNQLVWGRDTTDGNGSSSPASGLTQTNWAPNFITNVYVLGAVSNSLFLTNVQGLQSNVANRIAIIFWVTNSVNTLPVYIGSQGHPTLRNWNQGQQLATYVTGSPYVPGSPISAYELDGLIVGTNWQTNTAVWTLNYPGQVGIYQSTADTLYIGALGLTNTTGVTVKPYLYTPFLNFGNTGSSWFDTAVYGYGPFPSSTGGGALYEFRGSASAPLASQASLFITQYNTPISGLYFGQYNGQTGAINRTNIIGSFDQNNGNANTFGAPMVFEPMQGTGQGAASFTAMWYGTTSAVSSTTLNPDYEGLRVTSGGIVIGSGNQTAGPSNSLWVANTVNATNGIISYNTNIFLAGAATSWSTSMITITSGITNTYGPELHVDVNCSSGTFTIYSAGGLGAVNPCANAYFTGSLVAGTSEFILHTNWGINFSSGVGLTAGAHL